MDVWQTLLQNTRGFLPALVGALVGGIFSMLSNKRAIREERAKEVRRDEKEVQNLLDALGVELGTLWNFHMARIGAMVENLPEGGALEFYYPLTQDYFTIYNNNASKIGQVKDPILREAIVVCYNKCKKVVDGFKYNNELYRDYRNLLLMPPSSAQHGDFVKAKYAELVAYGQISKEDHFELKGYVVRLLRLLGERSQA